MSSERRIDVRIPSRYQDIDLVRRILSATRDSIPLTPDTLLKLEVCVIEAVGNAIRHAYGMRGDGVVDVALIVASDQLVIEVADCGKSMSAVNRHRLLHGAPPTPPDRLDVRDIPEGGMGFPILRAVLDSLEYTSKDGRNTLRMRKLFTPSHVGSA